MVKKIHMQHPNLSVVLLVQFILEMCATAKIAKKLKTPI